MASFLSGVVRTALPVTSKQADQKQAAESKPLQTLADQIKNAVEEYVKNHSLAPTFKDPSQTSPYPNLPDYPTFQLHHGGLSDSTRSSALAIANVPQFAQEFGSYLNILTNNTGVTSSQVEVTDTLNSELMERAVLDYYAELWHAPYPHDDDNPESYWGYCSPMDSSKVNLDGLWNACNYLSGKRITVETSLKIVKDKTGVSNKLSTPHYTYRPAPVPANNANAYSPVAFYSVDTHYSFAKTAAMHNLGTEYTVGTELYDGMCPLKDCNGVWPTEVPCLESGEMDLDALAELVEFFASKGHPIMVCFNYGSTWKGGAYDDVESACIKLRPILQNYNLLEREVHYDEDDYSKVEKRTGYWFHVDGTLGATYMPYMEMAYAGGLVKEKGRAFDFGLSMVHSIAMSGDDWIGAPIPSGIYMTRTKYQMLPPDVPKYIGTPDTTLAGSRQARSSAVFLWDNIARNSYEDQISKALRLEELAVYVENSFLELQKKIMKEDIYVQRTPFALTLRFKRVNDEIARKHTLVSNEGPDGYSYIVVKESVSQGAIAALLEDLSKAGAFAEVA